VTKRRTPPSHPPDHQDASDAELFERAMADVVRIMPDPRGRIRSSSPASPPPRSETTTDPADDGDVDFVAPGVDRREIRKLKRGEYAVADRRDLHGMTVPEACQAVRRFIENSWHGRHRCVCIVHGRGLHSEGHSSVLKSRVRECLRLNQAVLAYADAPRSDGGPGAAYVLLRK